MLKDFPSTRDLTTLSNFAALPSAIFLCKSKLAHAKSVAIWQVLACVLSLAFHSTESHEFSALGMKLDHELDDGCFVRMALPDSLSTWGRDHSTFLLRLDEIGALILVAFTCTACGGLFRTLRLAFGPCRSVTLPALGALVVSDLLLRGWAHAVLHAVWHGCAFALVPMLLSASGRATHATGTSGSGKAD